MTAPKFRFRSSVTGRLVNAAWAKLNPWFSEKERARRVNVERLTAAANALYDAGVWRCDRPVDEAALWTELRDALRRAPETSPKPLTPAT